MALMLPHVAFAVPQNNFLAGPLQGSAGNATPVASATPHTKGSWTQLLATTSYDAYGLVLGFSNNAASTGVQTNNLIDIGVGAAAAEQVVIPDIISTASSALSAGYVTQYFPIFVPKGSRLAARLQSNVASRSCNVMVMLVGGPSQPWPIYQKCVSIGIDTANSAGLTHTPGTGADSTFTNIGSPIDHEWRAAMLIAGTGSDTSMTALSYYARWGYGGQIMGEVVLGTATSEVVSSQQPGIPRQLIIPAGTQLQVQGRCSATAEELQFGMYGFY